MAINGWPLLLSGILCGLAVLTAATYLVTARTGRRRRGIWLLESHEAFGTRMRRRRLGAALLVAISAALFVGLNLLEPTISPAGYVIYWLIVLAMVVWLIGLGLLDLLQTRRMFGRTNRREEGSADRADIPRNGRDR